MITPNLATRPFLNTRPVWLVTAVAGLAGRHAHGVTTSQNGSRRLFARLLITGPRSSVVEHFLGKEEAAGSIPAVGSTHIVAMWGPPGFGGLKDLGA